MINQKGSLYKPGWIDTTRISPAHLYPEYYAPEYFEIEDQLARSSRIFNKYTLADLGEMVTGPFGSQLPTSKFTNDGIPLLRVQNIGDLEILEDNLVHISQETHQEISSSRLQSGDIVISKAGQIGATAIIPPSIPECNIVQHIIGLRVDERKVDKYYLAAFLASKYGRIQLQRLGVGTLLKYLSVADAKDTLIVLPSKPIQKFISTKVALAEKCRLEATRLWLSSESLLCKEVSISLNDEFYDEFEVLDLQSEHYQLISKSPSIAWVDPSLVEHELGSQYFHPRRINIISKLKATKIELARLDDITTRKSKRISVSNLHNFRYYVGLANIDSKLGYLQPISIQDSAIVGTSIYFRTDDVLFSKLRPYLRKVSICPPHISEACGSTELLVYRKKKNIFPYYVYFVTKSNLALYQVIDVTSGSTLPRLDPEIVDGLIIPLIPKVNQMTIDSNIRKVFAFIYKANFLAQEAILDVENMIEETLNLEAAINDHHEALDWDVILEDIESGITSKP